MSHLLGLFNVHHQFQLVSHGFAFPIPIMSMPIFHAAMGLPISKVSPSILDYIRTFTFLYGQYAIIPSSNYSAMIL